MKQKRSVNKSSDEGGTTGESPDKARSPFTSTRSKINNKPKLFVEEFEFGKPESSLICAPGITSNPSGAGLVGCRHGSDDSVAPPWRRRLCRTQSITRLFVDS